MIPLGGRRCVDVVNMAATFSHIFHRQRIQAFSGRVGAFCAEG